MNLRLRKPPVNDIEIKNLKKIQKIDISNIPVYTLTAGDQDILKIDFVFEAGKIFGKNNLIPKAVNELIDKGSKKCTSEKIAEKLDFYGAYFETEITKHHSSVILYTLSKYFKETFDIVSDFLFTAIFPEKEVEIYINNKYQSYKINRQKTDVVSGEVFSESIFGKNHPYGRIIKEIDFKNTKRKDLTEFHKNNFTPGNMFVMISGKIKNEHLKLTEDFLKSIKSDKIQKKQNLNFEIKQVNKKDIHIKVKNAVQSSIRAGKVTITNRHKDYFKLKITTAVLGGYFGSRLMSNLREDKGYTYGIYAGNYSYGEAGYFVISADTGTKVTEKAKEEIKKELKILRTELVPNNELDRVKKWFFGSFIKSFDGPLALSDHYINLIKSGFTEKFYYDYFNTVKNITPEEIRNTAEKYLNENTMTFVTAGK